jgi:parallel beta-helix repeat protein
MAPLGCQPRHVAVTVSVRLNRRREARRIVDGPETRGSWGVSMRSFHHVLLGLLSLTLTTCGLLENTPRRGETGNTPAPSVPMAAAPNSYFVSAQGDDRNDGSPGQPFATLRRATIAMREGNIKTTCVGGGIYTLSSTLTLSHADSGESIVACSRETPVLMAAGVHPASILVLRDTERVLVTGLSFANAGGDGALILSGSSHNVIAGNYFSNNSNAIVLAASSSDNVVSGNEIDNSAQSAIDVMDGSNANRFDSNLINRTGALGTAGGGFRLHGVNNNIISHNVVRNTAGMGIGVMNWDASTINIGNLVEYNLVQNTNTSAESIDSGAIYVLGRSQVDTRMIIQGNRVDGAGAPHPAHTVAIYLDDLSSGVVVRDNILTGTASDLVQIHGGRDDLVQNNIIDTGSARASAVLFQAAPADTHPTIAMTNNTVSHNIIYSTSKTPVVFVYYAGGTPTITDNLYYNTTGASMATNAPATDLRPRFGNPDFASPSQGDFRFGANSSASSIGFHAIDQSRMGLAPTTTHWRYAKLTQN